jgi:GAF domain-containing protein
MEMTTESDDRKRAESLLTAERRMLEMIAGGVCLTDVLQNWCEAIDAQSPNLMSSVMLMDPDGKRLWPTAGPRAPKDWISAITPLPIGPRMGSCGTAAFRKQGVITSDIASDPLWSGSAAEGYREVALRNGIRAAWSQPLISKSDELLGTFAMYYTEPRSPSAGDLQLTEGASHIALIATERERSRSLLKKAFDELPLRAVVSRIVFRAQVFQSKRPHRSHLRDVLAGLRPVKMGRVAWENDHGAWRIGFQLTLVEFIP